MTRYDTVLDWGLNPGPPTLDASTLPLGYRGGECSLLSLAFLQIEIYLVIAINTCLIFAIYIDQSCNSLYTLLYNGTIIILYRPNCYWEKIPHFFFWSFLAISCIPGSMYSPEAQAKGKVLLGCTVMNVAVKPWKYKQVLNLYKNIWRNIKLLEWLIMEWNTMTNFCCLYNWLSF
mgnify:CR=1 FL=1